MTELDRRLREMLADLSQVEIPPHGDVRFASLAGWDSILQFHLLLDVEREWHVEIPDAVGVELDSLEKLRGWVAERVGPGGR